MHYVRVMTSHSLLDRQMYDDVLAAELLKVPLSTLRWWLEGATRGRRVYEPVLRTEPTGSRVVTWGEFIEARYLREYRRSLGVALSQLRAFISSLRDELGVQYPLAHARPWVGPGRRLLVNAQNLAELPVEYWAVVEPQSGIQLLTHPAESFLERVQFDGGSGVVVRVTPNPGSPVLIDPAIRFGSPSVRGIPTDALADRVGGGDSIESVAEDFGISLRDVMAAIGYEDQLRSRAA